MTQHSFDSRTRSREGRDASRTSAEAKRSRPTLSDRQPEVRSVEGPVAYDVPEVMRRLSITRPTIYRFLRSGELRSFRLGSRRLISASA